MQQREVGCIVTLGGDGTNRAVAKGCGQVPLLAISTGTNNVFPQFLEGTIAGLAAGAVASGVVDVATATRPTRCLEVLRDGHPADLALVDVAVCSGEFVGSRAVWDPDVIRQIISTCARSDVVGLSSVGGFLTGLQLEPEEGLALEIGERGVCVLAPIAPGVMRPINVASHRRLRVGDVTDISTASGVLALDGERQLTVRRGERIQVRLSAGGPRVVDVRVALRQAVARGLFSPPSEDQPEGQRPAVVG